MRVLFLGELFVLSLLFPVVFRIFSKKRDKVDTNVIFSLFALIAAVLLLLSNGISLSVIAVVVPCIFVFVFNLRSLGRYFQRLRIDTYTAGSIISCIFGIIFVALGAFVLLRFYPVTTFKHLNSPECQSVEILKENKTGSFSDGFSEITSLLQPVSAVFYQFSPFSVSINQTDTSNFPVILFLPDVYTSINENRLTIESIARKNNVVLCADFYSKDGAYIDSLQQVSHKSEQKTTQQMIVVSHIILNSRIFRSFILQTSKFRADAQNIALDNSLKTKWKQIKIKEISSLIDYAKQTGFYSRISLIVADGEAAVAATDFLAQNNEDIPVFALNESIPGYISGMGNIAVNQPMLYNIVAKIKSDGWIQSQQIALRAEKAKAVDVVHTENSIH
ncbi:MAG: hypothetical protein GX297_07305 [Treponema sp.]|nr:hypothetical protein [Treponema sp.]